MNYKLPKLPTRDECQEIVKNSEAFYCAERVVEGQNVELYDYRLASISDFVDNNAFELRGLCFVETDLGWERNILMNKFFNINQTIGWMEEEVKDKEIVRIQNKEDGSIISFVIFPNGKVHAKSKMSFESPQAVMAQEIYEKSAELKAFVHRTFATEHTAIFELVGMDNQIVLEYGENELILLQIRRNDGEYVPKKVMDRMKKEFGLKLAEDFRPIGGLEMNVLDYLLHQKETSQESIEGWVITFEDGQMAKIKTEKYLQLHGLIGPDAFRENLLVKTILDGNIDDVISALVPGPKRDRIVALEEKVVHHFNHLVVEFKELRRKYFMDYGEDRTKFAKMFAPGNRNPHFMFGSVMKTLNTSFRDVEKTAEGAVKVYIESKCNGLTKAQEYLEKL